MVELLENRWVQRVGVVVATLILGVAIAVVISSRGPEDHSLGPVKLTAGGTVFHTGDRDGRGGPARQIVEEDLPLTGAEAVAAGWKDPILCDQGRGKYFEKVASEGFPYTLMYSSENELIGIYLISDTEKPAPWELTEEIKGGAGPIIDYEHWGLFIYFRDPTRSCSINHSGTCAQVPC